MIEVKIFYKDNEEISGFQIEGHAGFAKKGKDIVCSAISVLAQTAVMGLGEYLQKGSYKYSINDGYLKCTLQNGLTKEENHAAQIILKTMYLGIKSIEEAYAAHVRIIKEV